MKRKPLQMALAAALAFAAFPAMADIYRCTSADGSISYGDEPCPGNAAVSANVTERLQICTTEECKANESRTHAEAMERLRQEKATLNEMQDMRLRAEAQEMEQNLYRAQLRRMDMLESMLVAEREAASGTYFPAYPGYAGYAWDGWDRHNKSGCFPHCGSKGFPKGKPHHRRFEPSVRVRF
ncbi:MAG TPA: DUF4124 domain-containing protein [Burkholderiales bacterium]|nr:DUF4124 domain-containing protein [Burkholderiales bacterium]